MNRRILLIITTSIIFILFEGFFLYGATYLHTPPISTVIGSLLTLIYAALFAVIILMQTVPINEKSAAETERNGMAHTFFTCPHCATGILLDSPYGSDWLCSVCGERFR